MNLVSRENVKEFAIIGKAMCWSLYFTCRPRYFQCQ